MSEQQEPHGALPHGQSHPQPPYPVTPWGQSGPPADRQLSPGWSPGNDPGSYAAGPYAPTPYVPGPYAPGPYAPGPYAPGPYASGPYVPSPYVPGSRPAKPGGVVTAAVLGFVWGALGVLVTAGFVVVGVTGGSFVDDLAVSSGEPDLARVVTGVLVVAALLALAWTVVMVWGAALALKGRSRVPLIVGGSVSIAVTGLYAVAALADASEAGAGAVLVSLLLLVVSLLVVVLPCTRSATRFFATHRALRGR